MKMETKSIELENGDVLILTKNKKNLCIDITCENKDGDILYQGSMVFKSLEDLNVTFKNKNILDSLIPMLSPDKHKLESDSKEMVYVSKYDKMLDVQIFESIEYLESIDIKSYLDDFKLSNGDEFDIMLSGYNQGLIDFMDTINHILKDDEMYKPMHQLADDLSKGYTRDELIDMINRNSTIEESISHMKGYIKGLNDMVDTILKYFNILKIFQKSDKDLYNRFIDILWDKYLLKMESHLIGVVGYIKNNKLKE